MSQLVLVHGDMASRWLAQKSNKRTPHIIRKAIPSSSTHSGFSLIAHTLWVPQDGKMAPPRYYQETTRRPGNLHWCLVNTTNRQDLPPSNLKLYVGNLLFPWKEFQHTQLGTCLTFRQGQSAAPLHKSSSRAIAMRWSEANLSSQ